MKNLLIIAYCLVLAFVVNTQIPKNPKEFNTSIEKLPINFGGDSVEEIFLFSSKAKYSQQAKQIEIPLAKDEFETTEQFLKRVEEEKVKKAQNSSNAKFEKKMVLVLNYQLFEYDADNSLLTLRTVFTVVKDTETSAIINTQSESSSYYASNAFGLTVKVNKTVNHTYKIKFLGENFLNVFPITTTLSMDIPTAKALKPNLRTLILFQLTEPYQENDSSRTNPTLSSPNEIVNSTHTIIGKFLEIWFFDQSTGKIYFKKKF